MNVPFLTKNTTKLFFRLAAILGGAYFFLKVYPPPSFFLFRYPFLDYDETAWWAPRWLADYAMWGDRGADLASIFLIISLLLATVAFWGLYQISSGKKQAQSRQLYLLSAISTGLMLLVSAIFVYFNFPYLQTGIPSTALGNWQIPILGLIVGTGVVSLVSFTALAISLARRRLITAWVGVALIIGLLIVDINWLTLFFFPSQLFFVDYLAPISILLGMGWAIGLWQLGDVVENKPVEHQWPGIHWKKVGIGLGVYALLWMVMIGGIYTWDSRNYGALCQGPREEEVINDDTTKIVQHGNGYLFTYFDGPTLNWYGHAFNVSERNNGSCSLSTWLPPAWAVNEAWMYVPFAQNWLYQNEPFEPKEPVASFSIHVRDSEFDTLDEHRADQDEKRKASRDMAEKEGRSMPEIDEVSSTLGGQEAVRTVVKNDNLGNQRRSYHWQYYRTIKDGQLYEVGWQISATSISDRDEFAATHAETLEAMVDSFEFK